MAHKYHPLVDRERSPVFLEIGSDTASVRVRVQNLDEAHFVVDSYARMLDGIVDKFGESIAEYENADPANGNPGTPVKR